MGKRKAAAKELAKPIKLWEYQCPYDIQVDPCDFDGNMREDDDIVSSCRKQNFYYQTDPNTKIKDHITARVCEKHCDAMTIYRKSIECKDSPPPY